MNHFLLIAFAIQKYGKCFLLSAQNLLPPIRGQGTDDGYTNGTRIEL